MKNIDYLKQRLNKIYYYLSETINISLPIKKFNESDYSDIKKDNYILDRVNYYCKDQSDFFVSENSVKIVEFKKTKSFAYYADTKKVVRHFSKELKFDYLFGDIIHIPDFPCFLKSRPISHNNQNSILLKLNAIRHYQFLKDDVLFSEKKGIAVWRGYIYQSQREMLVRKFSEHPLIDVGHCDSSRSDVPAYKGFMSVKEQLGYKYIISVEGYDVATNLKWIMSSNSLCFMPKPRYETWFMEGRLQANFHYVELKDDFSDLAEKIMFYEANSAAALEIVKNANEYVSQFLDVEREEVISLLVAEKYFKASGQLSL